MEKLVRMVWLAVFALFASVAFAQPQERRGFSQAELDQVLAPVALYPDSLLSQILMAATYPQDVFEAAGHVRANPRLRGEDAVRSVDNAPWDPSVISLTAFPEVLTMMDERRDWTERLGDAYLAQPEQVLDTIQALRARADQAGNLRSSDELSVQRNGGEYILESPSPDVVYVPYYDSRIVYGSWWWPDYQPVWWNPWPGYAYRVGYRGFGWGYGIRVSRGYFFGSFDWRNRYVRYSNNRPWYYRGDYRQGNRWVHNRDHRNIVRDSNWRSQDGARVERRDDRRDDRRDSWRDDRREGAQGRDRSDRGDRDRRDGRDRDGGRDRRSQWTPAPQVAGQAQGFFAPQPQVRNASAPAERVTPRFQREARSFNAPRSAHVPQAQPAPARTAVPREERRVERQQRESAPAPRAVERRAAPERSSRGTDSSGRNLNRDHSGG